MISLSIFVLLSLVTLTARLLWTAFRPVNRFAVAEAFSPGAELASQKSTRRRRVRKLKASSAAAIDREMPDLVELMAVVLQTGESVQAAFDLIATDGVGVFAGAIKQTRMRLQLGESLDHELQALCVELPTAGVREFANKLAIAINRGTPLAQSLSDLAQTLRRRVANHLLAKAGANETKMLIPLVTIVLPVTVIFALYPSSAVLQLGF